MKITKKYIKEVLSEISAGVFSENSQTFNNQFVGVEHVWNVIRSLGVELNIIDAKYQHDNQGRPLRKTWCFTTNIDGKSYDGRLVASGAGPLNDSLSLYKLSVDF